eukprot:3008441-Rhodomonas_salina.2
MDLGADASCSDTSDSIVLKLSAQPRASLLLWTRSHQLSINPVFQYSLFFSQTESGDGACGLRILAEARAAEALIVRILARRGREACSTPLPTQASAEAF